MYQAKEFMAANRSRFYDDATALAAWADAAAAGDLMGHQRVRFADGSVLEGDAVSGAVITFPSR